MTDYYTENYGEFLPTDRSARILDLGCGQGNFVRYLQGTGYHNITAVDADPEAISALNSLDGVAALRLEVGSHLPPEIGGPWDLIIAKQMIYYLDRRDAAQLIRSLTASLSEGGQLIVEIFNGGVLSSRFTELKDPGILTAYNELGLRRLLERNGLNVERLFAARSGGSWMYLLLQRLWFKIYRLLLMLERGRDDELPKIGAKLIIAVTRRA